MIKNKERPTKLMWLDLEMTGLKPESDRILEVAVIITDKNLTEIASYHSLIRHDQDYISDLLLKNPFWANRPDGLKKILKESEQGKHEQDVEADLIKLANDNFLDTESIYLAGNSIRVDRAFIDKWLPDFACMLHYRMLDVSSFKLWWLANGQSEYKKKELHRALDDIRESIAELKHYSDNINFDGKS